MHNKRFRANTMHGNRRIAKANNNKATARNGYHLAAGGPQVPARHSQAQAGGGGGVKAKTKSSKAGAPKEGSRSTPIVIKSDTTLRSRTTRLGAASTCRWTG